MYEFLRAGVLPETSIQFQGACVKVQGNPMVLGDNGPQK